MRAFATRALALATFMLVASPAWAHPDHGKAPTESEASRRARAKELFKTGLEFFKRDDVERALDFFERSRAAFPSIQNISNAAFCLDRLGRYGEALELFELLLADYRNDFTKEERDAIGPVMKRLRTKVGGLVVAANAAGRLVIDGRARGDLPRRAPLRLQPGNHTVTILSDGYETYKTTVVIELGKNAKLDATLSPLTNAGQLRIETPGVPGATIMVDGASVGTAPWEGTLAPGAHVVWGVRGDVGSAPRQAIVVAGQKATLALKTAALGPPVTLSVKPATAALELGDVPLGKGRWNGRLPKGRYAISALEDGYFKKTQSIDVAAAPVQVTLDLVVDESHPRWPKGPGGNFILTALGGYAYSFDLGGDATSVCTTCPTRPGAHGGSAAMRAAYRFGFGTGIELTAGYFNLRQTSTRTTGVPGQAGLSYELDDDVLVHGPSVALGVSQHGKIAGPFGVVGRVGVGAMFLRSRNALGARVTDGTTTNTAVVTGTDVIETGVPVFVTAELAAQLEFEPLLLGLGITGLVTLTDGAELGGRRVFVPLDCPGGAAGCARTDVAIADEVVQRRAFAFGPLLTAGYVF